MDFYPLINSVRIALISTIIVFVIGIFVSYYVAKSHKLVKSILDVIFTLPLVLPPTVVGYLLILLVGPNRPIGKFFLEHFNTRLTMTWQSAILATAVVIFPLMYRTFRAAFEAYDETLSDAAKVLDIPKFKDFWLIRVPNCKDAILAGLVLAFTRGLGEYGATSMIAGYIPSRTATISTTVYQLWRTNDEVNAMIWILINISLSSIVLFAINMLESRSRS